jgi:hypothetical protein
MIDQVCPFQCSTNVEKALGAPPDWVSPTAKQLVVLGQDSPYRYASPGVPVGLGLVMIDQVCPFQCSANALLIPGPYEELSQPTAKQLVVLGHDTAYRNTWP